MVGIVDSSQNHTRPARSLARLGTLSAGAVCRAAEIEFCVRCRDRIMGAVIGPAFTSLYQWRRDKRGDSVTAERQPTTTPSQNRGSAPRQACPAQSRLRFSDLPPRSPHTLIPVRSEGRKGGESEWGAFGSGGSLGARRFFRRVIIALMRPSKIFGFVVPQLFDLVVRIRHMPKSGFHRCRLRGLNSRPSVYKTAALPLS
jgi:hypothetical protein